MLATWLLSLLWSLLRCDHQASQFWSRLQHLPSVRFFISSLYIFSFNPRYCAACPKTMRGSVWGLVIVGCVLGSLTLGLSDPMGSGTVDSREALVTNRTEVRPLLHTVAFASLTDEGVMQDADDVDDNDYQAIPHLSFRTNFLLPVLPMRGLIESTYFCLWPIHFLLRPQLLSSL